METFPFTLSINDFQHEFAKLLQAFRTPGSGYDLLQVLFLDPIFNSDFKLRGLILSL
jgi:hypothetical protein